MKNLSHSFRVLTRRPAFTAAAVLVLALGIGANTAIFSLVNAFLLKPLAIRQADQLVGLYSRDTRKPDNYRAFSYPNYVDLRGQAGVFTGLAAHNLAMVGLTEGDTTRRLFADMVSSNYFDVIGTPLLRGRVFTADEERPGSAAAVVIVSYSFWKRHGADPAMLGRSLRLNGRLFTVIGITPEGFTGTTALISAELYTPLGAYDVLVNDFENRSRTLASRDTAALIVLARLRPGTTIPAADAQLCRLSPSPCKKPGPSRTRTRLF